MYCDTFAQQHQYQSLIHLKCISITNHSGTDAFTAGNLTRLFIFQLRTVISSALYVLGLKISRSCELSGTALRFRCISGALFSHLLSFEQHVLRGLLPALSDHDYNLRPRPHNLSLSCTMNHRNFIHRLAFKNTY